jgi:hypothetical protein
MQLIRKRILSACPLLPGASASAGAASADAAAPESFDDFSSRFPFLKILTRAPLLSALAAAAAAANSAGNMSNSTTLPSPPAGGVPPSGSGLGASSGKPMLPEDLFFTTLPDLRWWEPTDADLRQQQQQQRSKWSSSDDSKDEKGNPRRDSGDSLPDLHAARGTGSSEHAHGGPGPTSRDAGPSTFGAAASTSSLPSSAPNLNGQQNISKFQMSSITNSQHFVSISLPVCALNLSKFDYDLLLVLYEVYTDTVVNGMHPHIPVAAMRKCSAFFPILLLLSRFAFLLFSRSITGCTVCPIKRNLD